MPAPRVETGPAAPEPTEQEIRSARFPLAERKAMITRGEIRDAATVAAWRLVSRR